MLWILWRDNDKRKKEGGDPDLKFKGDDREGKTARSKESLRGRGSEQKGEIDKRKG